MENSTGTMGKNPGEMEREHSKFGRAEKEEVDGGRAQN